MSSDRMSGRVPRRAFLLATAALGSTMLFSACAPSKPPGQNTGTGATSPGGSTAPSAGPKDVNFWIPWGQPERQKWVTDWGTTFTEKYPDHVLKMEFVGFGNMRQ